MVFFVCALLGWVELSLIGYTAFYLIIFTGFIASVYGNYSDKRVYL